MDIQKFNQVFAEMFALVSDRLSGLQVQTLEGLNPTDGQECQAALELLHSTILKSDIELSVPFYLLADKAVLLAGMRGTVELEDVLKLL